MFPGIDEHFRIPLPLEPDSIWDSPAAKFSRKRRELTVTWNIQRTPRVHASETIVKCCSEESLPVVKKQTLLPVVDCMNLLKEEIEHAMKECTVDRLKSIASLGGCSVLLSEFSVEGTASIQEQKCDFNVSVSFDWEILDTFGGYLGSQGHGEVSGLTTGGTPRVLIKSVAGGGTQAKNAGEWMKRHGACLVAECLKTEDLGAAVLSASEETRAFAIRDIPNLDIGWAAAWFQQKVPSLRVNLFGGLASANFLNASVTGNLRVEVQKGAPFAVFNLRVSCEWLVASSTGRAEGTLLIEEFSSGQDIEKLSVQVESLPGKKASGQLMTAFRQQGVSAFRSVLRQFSKELQTHIGCYISTS